MLLLDCQRSHPYGDWLVQRDFQQNLTLGGELFAQNRDTDRHKGFAGLNLGDSCNINEHFSLLFRAGHSIAGDQHTLWYFALYWTRRPAHTRGIMRAGIMGPRITLITLGVTDLPRALICLVIAAVWGWAGWWLYRLVVRGWRLILVAMVLFAVSAVLTYTHHDISELYQLQGLPQAQIDQMQKMGLFTGSRMSWLTALGSLPFLGYLLFIKKYLRKVSGVN